MISLRIRLVNPTTISRHYSKFTLKKKKTKKQGNIIETTSVQPTSPARTRFAPSPTGYLHLGSLRTALYNYLLAKSTGGQFLLRLEDTDQNRLVEDAEQNIYDSLKWTGLTIDEGPQEGGPYGPYRQSDRKEIYQKYAQMLLENGQAYYCGCSKDRLLKLRESASKLQPPTTVTYDRKCLHELIHTDEDHDHVIRFKSPDVYPEFTDLLHGKLNMQPQYNHSDRRYDDFVIMKSDGLPTYHFANVVDDHLMKITHVIRGEEWLPSTPKHISLYKAFGWSPPQYIHIPLLTSLEDKKLSKRQGDIGILSMKEKGILPEALVNFVSLFGWSPPRIQQGVSSNETMSLTEIVQKFSLDNLTKGNAKVNDSKLYFFNKYHLHKRLNDPQQLLLIVEQYLPKFQAILGEQSIISSERLEYLLKLLGPSLTTVDDLLTTHSYLFELKTPPPDTPPPKHCSEIISMFLQSSSTDFNTNCKEILDSNPELTKKEIFQAVRYGLSGGVSGVTIPVLIDILGEEEYRRRLNACI
ncbi:Glutamate--tRNA ligase mitochondrial [Scheffersomyces spartinae]|uniref:Glutamate--tRNA ligase, mitochondrial n=1 Tax=Scheffersomyces spartinae TaxID=45513 RepID=A0A9P7V693_9ASCO|nr:Glutamate--tRNA ligase mitochondrial [Scheffersomyces spartinae]KAG7192158.1 Glutamate--tRNA ligase mitochondrial [Scheffersomyces spartinae]